MKKRIKEIIKFCNKLILNNRTAVFTLSTIIITISLSIGLIEISLAYCLKYFLVVSGFISGQINDSFLYSLGITTNQIIILLLLINCSRIVIQILNTQVTSYLAEIINIRVKSIILFDFLYQSPNHPRSSGDVFYNFIEIFPKSIAFFNSIIILLSFCIQAMVLFSMMCYKTPKEALSGLLGVGIIGTLVILTSKKMKYQSTQIPIESRDLTSRVEKVSKNLLFFNIMRTKNGELISFGKNLANLSNLVLKQTLIASSANAIPQLLGFTFVIFFISRAFFDTTASALVSFLYLFLRFTNLLSSISQQFTNLYTFYPQLSTSHSFLETVGSEIERKSMVLTSSLDIIGRTGKKSLSDNLIPTEINNLASEEFVSPPIIEIKDLYFKYPASNTFIFSDFKCVIPPGTFCGIKGESGKGKSTLLMLIAGILNPTHGVIAINDESPHDFFSKRNQRIGYVGAEPYLIRGSLYENLIYGLKYKPNEQELWDSLRKAKASDFVEELGLDYTINEDHSGISAGQKQRICIARAFLNNPSLLILDEATSNLDPETERKILKELEKLKNLKTIIFVSHRTAPLASADQIISL